jgi:hypothetical protein
MPVAVSLSNASMTATPSCVMGRQSAEHCMDTITVGQPRIERGIASSKPAI